jgi:hypothetical protein
VQHNITSRTTLTLTATWGITAHQSQCITVSPSHNATVTTALRLLAIFSLLFLVLSRQARSKYVYTVLSQKYDFIILVKLLCVRDLTTDTCWVFDFMVLCLIQNLAGYREIQYYKVKLLFTAPQINGFLHLTFKSSNPKSVHVSWVPYHHSMASPQVADGGDGHQIWRVAANILNKQSRTADKGWSSILGVGRGANNSSQ